MNEHEREVPEDVVEALADCEGQVDHLKLENRLLRDASRTFGALAERLNETLESERVESERRRGEDRRARPRAQADRRQTTAAADRSGS
jgi:hypothetical protein